MNLHFTDEELAFRAEIRAWVREHLPADISHKVRQALRLDKDDMQRWARISAAAVAFASEKDAPRSRAFFAVTRFQ